MLVLTLGHSFKAVGYLEPCGMNIPHTHPRATEINFAVNGTLRTGMLAENGARFVFNNVKPGSATVFPRGAIHFEMNTECCKCLLSLSQSCFVVLIIIHLCSTYIICGCL